MLNQGQVSCGMCIVCREESRIGRRILGADAFLAFTWVRRKVVGLLATELFLLSALSKVGLAVSVKQKGAGIW